MQTSVLPGLTAAATTAVPVSKPLRLQVPGFSACLKHHHPPIGIQLHAPAWRRRGFLTGYIIKHVLFLRHWKVSQMLSLSGTFSEGTENRRAWVLCPHHIPTLKCYLCCLTLGFLEPFPMNKFLCSIDLQFRHSLRLKEFRDFLRN